MSDDVTARLDRIEGILRAARLHEEGCPLAMFASPCTCWLAMPREETAP